jgi:hypothetical protein
MRIELSPMPYKRVTNTPYYCVITSKYILSGVASMHMLKAMLAQEFKYRALVPAGTRMRECSA